MENKSISDAQRTRVMILLLTATFITSLSVTVTGSMIPNFTDHFGISPNLAQWLTSGASLISGVILPVTAYLIKRITNKIYFLSAMAVYTAGSLAAALSFSFPMLLVSRLFQAVGCGMQLSFAQAILLELYPKEKHGMIMAVYSMAVMLSTVAGPTYAGLITDRFGWKGVFVPLYAIGALLIVGGIFFMKNVIGKEQAELNLVYLTLSSLGFSAFLIGINSLSGGLLRLKSGGLILAGILLLTAFSFLQLRAESPMLELRVFRYPSFTIAVFLSLCLYLISMGSAMILPIYAKTLRGFSDTAYGLATIVGSALSVFVNLAAGRSYDRTGVKPLFATGIILYAAYSLMGLFFTINSGIVYIGFVYFFQSIAMAAINSPASAMALGGLKGKERVDGSAIYNTLRQISSSLSSTLAVLIYTLTGSGITAVRVIYVYFGLVTAAILFSVIFYLHRQ